jgi:hypothetical protein
MFKIDFLILSWKSEGHLIHGDFLYMEKQGMHPWMKKKKRKKEIEPGTFQSMSLLMFQPPSQTR